MVNLTFDFYQRNDIEGRFLSSGILRTTTAERCQEIRQMLQSDPIAAALLCRAPLHRARPDAGDEPVLFSPHPWFPWENQRFSAIAKVLNRGF